MECIRAADIMVPLAVYGTVPEDTRLYDAMLALKRANDTADVRDRPNALFVLDRGKKIIGRIDLRDLVMAIEPKYGELGYPRQITHSDCCSECDFVSSIRRVYGAWRDTLENLCSSATDVSAGKIMHRVTDMDLIDANASLEEALNRFLTGRREYLLVTRGAEFAGVLRLSDAAGKILDMVEECGIASSEETPEAEAA